MADAQSHRGPDDSGVFVSGHAGLSHVRLSIIDLSKDAAQPMVNDDSSVIIVHNGEIYNYLEIKDELKRLGCSFKSKSDTEVILRSYEEWGEGCLKRFNGMWSFAILDLKKKLLFCSRDRFGVKPFYYYTNKDVFVFSSEIKSLLRHPAVKREPNDSSIYNYLVSGYGYMDISDDTFFKGVKQLKPAHYMKISLEDGASTQHRFWDINPDKKTAHMKEEEVYKKFLDLFRDSVKLRLRSDVPLGVSLSGGLDSSSIACVAKDFLGDAEIQTFSSCFEDARYDERQFIKPVLEKTGAKAHFVFTKPENLFDEIEEIIWHQDEPYSTLSIFPQWYVMKLAREKGVKVLLSGQGGDETLGGYHKYFYYLFADLISSMKWGRASEEIGLYKALKGKNNGVFKPVAKILISNAAPSFVKEAVKLSSVAACPSYLNNDFNSASAKKINIEKRFQSILNNDLYNAMKISPLPSLLHIDDRSSMAHSVESRSPFLDYRLVEYLFSLGPEFKIRNGITKFVLRQSMKGILPEEVRTRKDKMGYATPLESWFKSDLKSRVHDILNSRKFLERPYFNKDCVLRKFDDFVSGKKPDAHYAIWSWVNLELWLRKFIDGKNII
jgi:asparagine synthase (glutamine-hydrolysing)